jgi:hypothetical protein
VWTGPDGCVEATYFTTEAEARTGEQKELPPELHTMMVEFQDLMQNTEFLDLSHPMLHRAAHPLPATRYPPFTRGTGCLGQRPTACPIFAASHLSSNARLPSICTA